MFETWQWQIVALLCSDLLVAVHHAAFLQTAHITSLSAMNSSHLGPGSEANSWPAMRSQKMDMRYRYLGSLLVSAPTSPSYPRGKAHMTASLRNCLRRSGPSNESKDEHVHQPRPIPCNRRPGHLYPESHFVGPQVGNLAAVAKTRSCCDPRLVNDHWQGPFFQISGSKIEARFGPHY